MKQAAPSERPHFSQWAVRQLTDYDALCPGTLFGEGITLNVAEAYELQAAVTQLRCDRGEQVIGYKVGCTSPKIREQLGIEHCVTGRLYAGEQHSSGVTLSRSRYANLAIEGELAVELAREPNDSDFSEPQIPACVARVFPVIELHQHVMRGEHPTAGELIANNAIHAGFVAGNGISRAELRSRGSTDSWTLSISADDKLLDRCAGSILSETIKASLEWLTEVVRQRGERLLAGQIILTGSIPSLIPVREDCRLRVEASPVGSVQATFLT